MHSIDLQRQKRVQVRFAVGFFILGAAVLLLLSSFQSFPEPFWLWGLFAMAFVYLEWRTVEVNDRLVASNSVMVAMTAGVVFGPESAILGVAAMAALGPLTPTDIKGRRWFQPAVNFGQMIVAASVAIALLQTFLPESSVTTQNLWLVAVGSGIGAVTHGLVNYNLVQLIVRQVFGRGQVRPWSNLRAIVLPSLGMGFLGGLLGASYHLVGYETLPLMFVVFFVGHLTLASYAELREAQESTLRGFVKALEAKDLYTRGHTERVAYFAEMIGEQLGFNGTQLERLRWAALIHDVGKLAVPRDLIRKRARLSTEEYAQMQAHVHLVEELLAEVQFLEPMVEIASNHHAHDDGNGYHGSGHNEGEKPTIESCILAVADSFDAMTSTRSYRVALSQDYAFTELRRHAGTQFDPVVVEAFIVALGRSGEWYGSPDINDEEEARRRAEEALLHD